MSNEKRPAIMTQLFGGGDDWRFYAVPRPLTLNDFEIVGNYESRKIEKLEDFCKRSFMPTEVRINKLLKLKPELFEELLAVLPKGELIRQLFHLRSFDKIDPEKTPSQCVELSRHISYKGLRKDVSKFIRYQETFSQLQDEAINNIPRLIVETVDELNSRLAFVCEEGRKKYLEQHTEWFTLAQNIEEAYDGFKDDGVFIERQSILADLADELEKKLANAKENLRKLRANRAIKEWENTDDIGTRFPEELRQAVLEKLKSDTGMSIRSHRF